MLISVASDRYNSFRSLGSFVTKINQSVEDINKKIPNISKNGISENSIDTGQIISGSIDSTLLASESITADKISLSALGTTGTPNQRVPAALTDTEYWQSVVAGNVPAHRAAYFAGLEPENISVTKDGIVFSPERSLDLSITHAGLELGGVVTLNLSGEHGYEIGDSIEVTEMGSPYDGVWSIVEVPSTTSLCYSLGEFAQLEEFGFEKGGYITAESYEQQITRKSIANGIVTLTIYDDNALGEANTAPDDMSTANNSMVHGYSVGEILEVAGAGSPYDGIYTVSAIPEGSTNLLKYDINKRVIDYAVSTANTAQIGNVAVTSITNSVVTFTTSDAHNLTAGQSITTAGFTPSDYDFDSNVLSIPSANTFTAVANAVITNSVSTFGNVSALTSENTSTTQTVSNASISNTVLLTYQLSEAHGLLPDQIFTTTGYSPSGYNFTANVYSTPGLTSFTALANVANAVSTIGNIHLGRVRVDAEARLYLTGKHQIPTSRKITINWISTGSINFFVLFWKKDDTSGIPEVLPVDSDGLLVLSGKNTYSWTAGTDAEYYAVMAQLPGDAPEATLRECYVFETVGDQNRDQAAITGVSFNNAVATLYTASPHALLDGDTVDIANIQQFATYLGDDDLLVSNVSSDQRSFSVPTITYNYDLYKSKANTYSVQQYVDGSPTNTFSNVYASKYQYISATDKKLISRDDFVTVSGVGTFFDQSGSVIDASPLGQISFVSRLGSFYGGFADQNVSVSTIVVYQNSNVAVMVLVDRNTRLGINPYNIGFRVGETIDVPVGSYVEYVYYYDPDLGFGTIIPLLWDFSTEQFGGEILSMGGDFIVYRTAYTNTQNSRTLLADSNQLGSLLAFRRSWFMLPISNSVSSGAVVSGGSVASGISNSNGIYAVNGAIVGGSIKRSSTELTPAGLVLSEKGGQGVNLTDDASDNYLSVYNANAEAVASIANTGDATFNGAVSADALEIAGGSITFNDDTLIGELAEATYNGNTEYTGSTLEIFSRGTVYQATWDVPTAISNNTANYGLAAGDFTLDSGRVYNFFVSASGMRATVNLNASFELLLSTSPIRATDTNAISHMNYVLKTTDTLGFWSNLDGFFETKPPTDPSKLTFSNAAWSRPNSSSTLTITLPSASGDYLATGDLVGIYGVTNTAGSNVDSTFSGTYALTKTNATTYTITTAEAAAANGVSNGTALTLKKLDPWMSGVATTHSITGASGDGTTVTYTSNHLFSIGQRVTVTGVTPTAYNISNAIVTATTSTSFKILSNATATYTSGGSATLATVQLEETKNYLPANTKIYYVIRLRHSATTNAPYNILVNQTGNPAGMFAITDVGQAKELTYAAQADNWKTGLPPGKVLTTVAGSTVTATLTLNADSSAYYDNYGKGDSGTSDPYANQNSIYQGNPGTASGTKRSAVRFPAITFVKETNLQITKVEVYLRNRHSYNSSGLTTRIGFHTASSLGSSIPTASNTTPVTTTFSKGQGKWVTLTSSPTSFLAGLVSAKTFRGIVISLTDNSPITYDSSLSNYGYFDGNTQSDEPKLRITYTYTE